MPGGQTAKQMLLNLNKTRSSVDDTDLPDRSDVTATELGFLVLQDHHDRTNGATQSHD